MYKRRLLIQRWRLTNAVQKLIAISILLSLLHWLLSYLFSLFGWGNRYFFDPYLSLSGDLSTLLSRPWTLISYMWFHSSFGHLFFNMLLLYSFGSIFSRFFSYRQTISLYLLSGIFGGIFYPIVFELMDFLGVHRLHLPMYGSSASVLSLIAAVGVYVPHKRTSFFFVGSISYKVLSIIIILLVLFSNDMTNLGGTIAHLGGVFSGGLFGWFLRTRGIDITKSMGKAIDTVVNLLSKPFSTRKKRRVHGVKKETFSAQKENAMREEVRSIEAVLDKVKRSGYSVLTDEERKILFQGKENDAK